VPSDPSDSHGDEWVTVEPRTGGGRVVDLKPDDTQELSLDDLPKPPFTGDSAVDSVTDEVRVAAAGPLEGQLAAYERAHRTLQDRLADVEG